MKKFLIGATLIATGLTALAIYCPVSAIYALVQLAEKLSTKIKGHCLNVLVWAAKYVNDPVSEFVMVVVFAPFAVSYFLSSVFEVVFKCSERCIIFLWGLLDAKVYILLTVILNKA